VSWKSKLSGDRTYIIPTRTGLLFIAATLVILFIGSGYSNNLVNLLAFFMLSLVFVSMVLTNLPLKTIALQSVEVDGVFAAEKFSLKLIFKNSGLNDLFGIKVEVPSDTDVFFVRGDSTHKISVELESSTRGWQTLPRVQVSSVYPLGLFYAWKIFTPVDRFLVYPARSGTLPFPKDFAGGIASDLAAEIKSYQKLGGDDFKGHRPYIAGDSPRHIDWKAHARGRPLLVKELDEGAPPDLIFSWNALIGLSSEERLSQLTTWIDQAFQQDLSFQLLLPETEFPPSQGLLDVQKCLAVLAVYGREA
jgi:uncharacterized protein (DUF58 family)